jgi:hypothetical protein
MQLKPQVHLPEMRIAAEDLRDLEILHDHHACEIDKGDVWLIVVLLPQLPSAAELRRRNVDQQVLPGIHGREQGINKALA